MEIIPQLISRYSVFLYFICGIACVYFLFTGMVSLRELKRAVFRLERNAVVSRAVSSLSKAVVCLAGGLAVFVISALAPAQSSNSPLAAATGTPSGIQLPPTSMPTAVITDVNAIATTVAMSPTAVLADSGTAAPTAGPGTPDVIVVTVTPDATTAVPPTDGPTPTPTPADTPTPAYVSCTSPDAQLTNPVLGEHIVGAYTVRGTAVVEPGGYYKVEILTQGAVLWSFLGRGDATVNDGVLLENFNAGALPPGSYPFRLSVIGADSDTKAYCTIQIELGQ
jgi:hypothetical protein